MSSSTYVFCKGCRWIAGGWVGFIAENVILSHNREEIISRFGKDNYTLAYSTLSTATCGSIAYGLFRYGVGQNAFIARRSPIALMAGIALQTAGLVGLSQTLPPLQIPVALKSSSDHNGSSSSSTGPSKQAEVAGPAVGPPVAATPSNSGFSFTLRCPIDFQQSRNAKGGSDEAYGIERITRHPTLWSLGLIGLGTASLSIFLPEVIFGSFAGLFAAIGSSHQDYRHRRGSGGYLSPERELTTSNVPFAAVLAGRQSLLAAQQEMKTTNAALAVATAIPLVMRQLKRVR
jgi:uncharacterized membrane protein